MVLGGRIGDKIHIIDYRRVRVMGNLEKLDEMKENILSKILKHQRGLDPRFSYTVKFISYNLIFELENRQNHENDNSPMHFL